MLNDPLINAVMRADGVDPEELGAEFARVMEERDEAAAWNPESLETVPRAVADHWRGFWETGGAIELSGSTDSRAPELERRIVLSQYLTAVNCAGELPPQETGLF